MYEAKILADSINPADDRITTFELTYPRMVHAELMTHRMFSRNSASSRAIPTKKLMRLIKEHPVMPKWWGKNQSGMQAREELQGEQLELVKKLWLKGRDQALELAEELRAAGLHKQIANRPLEAWMFITVIVTSTEYDNWYHLRDDPEAQPEIAWVAGEMSRIIKLSTPKFKGVGEWHLPLVETEDKDHPLFVDPNEPEIKGDPLGLAKICTARCARVSFLTHDGERELLKDLELHNKLTNNGHWSPFEHAAEANSDSTRFGNFFGWRQYRKLFKREHIGRRLL